MWVFTKHGFYSIVQDKDNEEYLIVRARVKGDIEYYFPDDPVDEDAGSDYRYRTRRHRSTVSALMNDIVDDIDYTNYKAAVNMVDPRRSEYYGMVWAIMADMQFELQNKE